MDDDLQIFSPDATLWDKIWVTAVSIILIVLVWGSVDIVRWIGRKIWEWGTTPYYGDTPPPKRLLKERQLETEDDVPPNK